MEQVIIPARWRKHRRATGQRHTGHYLAYAESHNQPQAADYEAPEREWPNLLAVLDRTYQSEQWAAVQQLVMALVMDGVHGFLPVRGYWQEQRTWLGRAIQAAEAERNRKYLAALLHCSAILAQDMGDYPAPRRLYRRSLAIKEQLRDRVDIANGLVELGNLARLAADYDRAETLYHQSLAISQEIGSPEGIALARWGLGNIALDRGRPDRRRTAIPASPGYFSVPGQPEKRSRVAGTVGRPGQGGGVRQPLAQGYAQAPAVE